MDCGTGCGGCEIRGVSQLGSDCVLVELSDMASGVELSRCDSAAGADAAATQFAARGPGSDGDAAESAIRSGEAADARGGDGDGAGGFTDDPTTPEHHLAVWRGLVEGIPNYPHTWLAPVAGVLMDHETLRVVFTDDDDSEQEIEEGGGQE